jgi:threonine/homoserine/homoserine lactone efflux protein
MILGAAEQSLIAFIMAAGLLTVTPGIDTALVLRTAGVEGAQRALLAGLGIALGCLAWGAVVAAGLGALLAASEWAYTLLRYAGAAYLLWLGLKLIRSRRTSFGEGGDAPESGSSRFTWARRGFLTNLLNPKVGVFYVSFLPQFVPAGADVAGFSFLLAAIHASLGLLWFALLVAATRPIARMLRRPPTLQWLDRITGTAFLLFAGRMALSRD